MRYDALLYLADSHALVVLNKRTRPRYFTPAPCWKDPTMSRALRLFANLGRAATVGLAMMAGASTLAVAGDACCGCESASSCCETRKTLFDWCGGAGAAKGEEGEEDDAIATDRPDFTENTALVGRGVAQVEFGYTYTFDNDGVTQSTSNSDPEALIRVGVLADWLELRLAQNYVDNEIGGIRTSGAEDLYLGMKIALTEQQGALPAMTLLPQMTVPTGGSQVTADEVLPGLNWLYSWDLSDKVELAASTQFNGSIDEGSGDTYTEWAQSASLGFALSEKWGLFTETFGLFPHQAETQLPEYYFDTGLTYLISNDIQWDIRIGVGLNDAADDYFAGTGLSIRFK